MDRRTFLTFSSLSFASLLAGCGGGGGGTSSDADLGVFRSEKLGIPSDLSLLGVLPSGDFVVATEWNYFAGIVRRDGSDFLPLRLINADGSENREHTNGVRVSVSASGRILLGFMGSSAVRDRWFLIDPLQRIITPESEIALPRSYDDYHLAPDDTIYTRSQVYRRSASGVYSPEPLDPNFRGSLLMMRSNLIERFGVLPGKIVPADPPRDVPLDTDAAYVKDGVVVKLPRLFPGRSCEAMAYRGDGAVLGVTTDDAGVPHGVLWENGSVTDLGPNVVPQFFAASGALLGGIPASGYHPGFGLNSTDWENPRVRKGGASVPYRIVGPAAGLEANFPLWTQTDGTIYINKTIQYGITEFGSLNEYYKLTPDW